MAKARSNHPVHPVNWGHALGIGTLRLLSRLPARWALALGSAVGAIGYRLARQRRLIIRRNLELCFPELDKAVRERLVRENFRYTGRGLMELALSWFGGPSVDRLPLEVEGLEHLRAAQADDTPVILLSGHFTTVEICGRLLRQHSEMAVIYKPMDKRPLADRTMREGRARAIGPVLSKDDLRGIVRTLRKGLPVWYAGDQNYRSRQNVFAPFFGIPAATVTGLSRLARLSKARVVPIFYYARTDGPGYRVVFKPPLEGFPSGDEQADAERMNRIIEEAVRAQPAQYFWAHRRFKSQPDSDVNMYPGVKDHRLERRRRRQARQESR